MGNQVQSSLFEPAATSPIEASVGWISDLLFGGVAISLCVLAVAYVGLLMLTGRIRVRTGLSVIVGCFVLLGAPLIASGLMQGAADRGRVAVQAPIYEDEDPRRDLEAVEPDPYGGASLRR